MKTVYVLYKVGHLLSKVYTIKDAAQALGIHPKTLRRWEEKGKFTPLRTLGNQRRFSDKDLNLLAKLKAGEPIPEPKPRILTADQAAEKLHVSPATVQRWTKEGKLRVNVNDQLEPGYNEAEIRQLLQGPTLQAPELKPAPILPTGSNLVGLVGKYLHYAGAAGLVLALGLAGYLFFSYKAPLASPGVQQAQTPVVDVALPRTAQFLDGRITLGLNTGDLFYADSTGNLYLKNTALIDKGVATHNLQLLPSAPPDQQQIGQIYVDQNTGNLKYYDGLEWINLNSNGSNSATLANGSFPLDLTLGTLNATASAESLRITLAGDQSQFKILGGANQDLLTVNDDALYPVVISQPTQIFGKLLAPQFIDQDNNSYFLDPSSTTVSLATAGDATISSTLTFSKNGDYLTNAVNDYLVFSGGLGVGGVTSYGFSPDQKLNIRSGNVESSLTIGGNLDVAGNITAKGTITPDYVFDPSYPLLSPLQLKEFITSQRHLPGVPSAAEVDKNGLNIPQMLMALLQKTEENTLYILDLYDKNNHIIAPTVETQVLTTKMISPLAGGQITISGDASVSGTLYAKEIDSSTIDKLRQKISDLADKLTPSPTLEPAPVATETAILDTLPPATESGHLSLSSLESDTAFFKDYLAVLGQTTLTDVKINNSLTVNNITSLDNRLALQPSGLGEINFLAGLMTIDDTGKVTINGNLIVNGPIVASQINTLPDHELAVNIASGSAVSIYSQIAPLATFSGQTVSLANLSLEASGTATVSAGGNNSVINSNHLTDKSQVVVTFTSDYTPATKYWVKKNSAAGNFTVFVNYPVNSDTTLDWLIIN